MSQSNTIKIHDSWKAVLKDEFEEPYFSEIKQHILRDKQAGKTIYPPGSQIFNAFDSTPFDQVKVVIIGQDPYHVVFLFSKAFRILLLWKIYLKS